MFQRFQQALAALCVLYAPTPVLAAVGYQHLSIPVPGGAQMEVGVWYPADAVPKPQRLELFTQVVAADAIPVGASLPLVVISHGNGGSLSGHHDTALALAEAGFVVAAPTHPGDNFRDQSQATAVWLRTAQLHGLIDYMLADWTGHALLDATKIGAFGFSSGGFTVLAAAGGVPDLSRLGEHCRAHPTFFDCKLVGRELASGTPDWVHDRRIRAVVSAAPALGFTFGKNGLAGVRTPVQLWRADNDMILPNPFYAEAVRVALPNAPEMHVVAGAGHFDFLAPCSPALTAIQPVICTSASGFDRGAFHADFNQKVVRFFQEQLTKGR
ncbi:MAG: dienelactone hydrolase [Phenylobacterium sp.]|uniref:alpha/beta hydrolase family protein n=1 Tax=Phenylobacterium sp. TaxID=1871053 RepID=UPI00271FB0DD|nr:dienelactone hydrolase [Phenylobacterium sp.]MDO9433018.1 dienelactone hydrolase [Phenylobacterium sp.]